MPKIEGLKSVIEVLQKKALAASNDSRASVTVGYGAAYSLFVHENLQAVHPRGQAKFLEQPARQLKDQLAEIVKTALGQGKTMSQALLLAGLRLQRESQKLVPVDTGNLKASAFTRIDG